MRILLGLIAIISITSCGYLQEKNTDVKIARVGDEYLLLSQIQDVLPQGVSVEDSLLVVNNYIRNWLKESLILQKAELNLEDHQKDFQRQLDDYRKSLIIYSYEKELITQKLDTSISYNEMLTYYENNIESFDLKEDILKVRYLKVTKTAPKIELVREIYKSNEYEDVSKLKDYAHQNADKFYLDDQSWIALNSLLKEVPLQVENKAEFLEKTKFVELQDSVYYYFIAVLDYRLKEDKSPLSFEQENIKSIIINKRKLKLVNNIKNDLYKEAMLKKKIEIFDEHLLSKSKTPKTEK